MKTFTVLFLCSLFSIHMASKAIVGSAVKAVETIDMGDDQKYHSSFVQKESKNKVKALSYAKQTGSEATISTVSNTKENPSVTTNTSPKPTTTNESFTTTTTKTSAPSNLISSNTTPYASITAEAKTSLTTYAGINLTVSLWLFALFVFIF